MKHISISLLGLFLAVLPACGPQYAARPVTLHDAQFNPTLPCVPEAQSDGESADKTEFGVLRGQSYKCRDTSREVDYVALLGVFEPPSSAPMSQDRGGKRDAIIAVGVARQLCKVLERQFSEHGASLFCTPSEPVENGHVMDVEIDFVRGRARLVGRVRVSYPYLGAVAVVGKDVSDDDIRLALDIQLPKP